MHVWGNNLKYWSCQLFMTMLVTRFAISRTSSGDWRVGDPASMRAAVLSER